MSNLIISEVYKGSIAEEAGIEAGDSLISINGSNIVDVFDYRFMISEEALLLEIQKKMVASSGWILKRMKAKILVFVLKTLCLTKKKL